MTAIMSPCGKYRFRLERDCSLPFPGSKVIAYFGVNPSTADAVEDDATVRKWRGFTIRNRRASVSSRLTFSATDPRTSQICRQRPSRTKRSTGTTYAESLPMPTYWFLAGEAGTNSLPAQLRASVSSWICS